MRKDSSGALRGGEDGPRERDPDPRCEVRCTLSLESGFQWIRVESLQAVTTPEEFVAVAREIYERCLEGAPRFSRAIEDRSLPNLVENLIDGMMKLAREEANGFSLCPLVTESVRFASTPWGGIEVAIHFLVALLTFVTESECASSHQDLWNLCHTYYQDILLVFVRRRLAVGIDPTHLTDVKEAQAEIGSVLTSALTDLRSALPLRAFQERYEEGQERLVERTGFLFNLCAQMRDEARRRLGI
jgi:hypothetical protein